MTTLLLLGAALLVVGAAVFVLVVRASPTLIVSVGLGLAVFSGYSKHMGMPIPPDRLVMGLGFFLLLVGTERRTMALRVRFRSEQVLMLVLAGYAAISAWAVGTLFGPQQGAYALLDRLPITAWVLFSLAPLLWPDKRARNTFLVVMVCVGAYLGLTAFIEGLGAKSLTWPSYIHDPAVGIHYDRARGPMVEAAAFGLALFECAVAAVVAARTWGARWARNTAWAVAGMCLVGTLFTLTRSVWIGSILGVLAVCVASREWRRRLMPAILAVGVVIGAVLALSSSVSSQVETRSADESPIWDRLNLADAGIRVIEDRPLFGLGWRKFIGGGRDYFRLLPDIPQQGTTIDIHNIVLSIGAELGLVGLTLWLAVVGTTVVAPMVRRAPPELEDWRLGLIAMGIQAAVVALSTPFAYTFCLFFVWTWAGILSVPRYSRPRFPDAVPTTATLAAHPPLEVPKHG